MLHCSDPSANIRVKHLNSDIKQTRRVIVLLLLLLIEPKLIVLYRFSVKNNENRPVFRVKIAIF